MGLFNVDLDKQLPWNIKNFLSGAKAGYGTSPVLVLSINKAEVFVKKTGGSSQRNQYYFSNSVVDRLPFKSTLCRSTEKETQGISYNLHKCEIPHHISFDLSDSQMEIREVTLHTSKVNSMRLCQFSPDGDLAH